MARNHDYDAAKAEVVAQARAAGMTEKDLVRAFGRAENQDEFEEALMGGPVTQASESGIQICRVDSNGREVPPQPPAPAPKASGPSRAQDGPDISL